MGEEEEILIEITKNKFREVLEFLQEEDPASVIVLNLIKSHEREDETQETEFKVYTSKGETSSRVVIVTLTYLNKCRYRFVKMWSSQDNNLLLQQALMRTRKISWADMIFEGVNCKFIPTLEQVLQNKNVRNIKKEEYKCMFLPHDSYDLLKQNVTMPEEFIIRSLTSEDAKLIDETWAYHGPTTYDYIHHSIVFHGGLGLVHKHNDQLVSWAVGVMNTIGMVHTLPHYRRRGLAEIVIQALARKLITASVQPVCLIKSVNEPSFRLFKKLGFVDAGVCYCIDI